MVRARWVLAGFLLLPIAELAVFLAVAAEIGVTAALCIMLATSLAGAAVIRGAGRAPRSGLRAASAGMHALDAAIPAFFTVIAGILLLVPGFLTDFAGALLLVPALQRRLARLMRGLGHRSGRSDTIVELEPDEWHRVGDAEDENEPKPRAAPRSCPSAPAVLATPPGNRGSASRVKEER